MELTRSAALGELAADIGHDVANALFGVSGLVELMLDDATPGSQDETRLKLLETTMVALKTTLGTLVEFARAPGGDEAHGDIDEASRAAVALVRYGLGSLLPIEEHYSTEPVVVPCPRAAIVEAVLHLLLAARDADRIVLEVLPGSVRVSPVPESSLGVVVAARIAVDHGGTPERAGDRLSLRWTG